jgi:hypothetical protein
MAICVGVGNLSSWELSAMTRHCARNPSATPPWGSGHAAPALAMFCIRIHNSLMYVCACVSASRWHAQFLGGVAAKRWGCRALLSLGVLGSGVACMLTPLAASHSWAAAFAMRVTAGVSEGVVFPCTCKRPPVDASHLRRCVGGGAAWSWP